MEGLESLRADARELHIKKRLNVDLGLYLHYHSHHWVGGSSPSRGAIQNKGLRQVFEF